MIDALADEMGAPKPDPQQSPWEQYESLRKYARVSFFCAHHPDKTTDASKHEKFKHVRNQMKALEVELENANETFVLDVSNESSDE